MRYTKLFSLTLMSGLLTLTMLGSAFADLNASQIASDFNSLNGNKGIQFTFTSVQNENRLTNSGANTFASTSAYASSTAGGTYFSTVCVEPGQSIVPGATVYSGKLDYSGGATRNSSGYALTLGAATLYQRYAAGSLAGYDYSAAHSNFSEFSTAIAVLTGQQTLTNWTTNTFLNNLLGANNNQAYWKGSYDPGQQYSEIGEFSVFVLQVTTVGGTPQQDMIYVAKANSTTPVVPEPATVLLWSLGSLTAVGMTWLKRRRSMHMFA